MSKFVKLNNQPLTFVLAEFRFSEVREIEKYIPQLQEAWRKQYPLSQERIENVVNILGPNSFETRATKRWSFISADQTNAIDVDTHRIIFYTSAYPRFEGFSAMCKEAIVTLKKIVDPTLILRIGLRYSDLIIVSKGETIEDLVQPQFAFPGELNDIGVPKQRTEDLYYETEIGLLVIRILYGELNLSCLPDIQTLPVTIKTNNETSLRMILDFDHIWNANKAVDFDMDTILDTLGQLHDKSRNAFWTITTDYAKETKWA